MAQGSLEDYKTCVGIESSIKNRDGNIFSGAQQVVSHWYLKKKESEKKGSVMLGMVGKLIETKLQEQLKLTPKFKRELLDQE